jgi:hypothetical protein
MQKKFTKRVGQRYKDHDRSENFTEATLNGRLLGDLAKEDHLADFQMRGCAELIEIDPTSCKPPKRVHPIPCHTVCTGTAKAMLQDFDLAASQVIDSQFYV